MKTPLRSALLVCFGAGILWLAWHLATFDHPHRVARAAVEEWLRDCQHGSPDHEQWKYPQFAPHLNSLADWQITETADGLGGQVSVRAMLHYSDEGGRPVRQAWTFSVNAGEDGPMITTCWKR